METLAAAVFVLTALYLLSVPVTMMYKREDEFTVHVLMALPAGFASAALVGYLVAITAVDFTGDSDYRFAGFCAFVLLSVCTWLGCLAFAIQRKIAG